MPSQKRKKSSIGRANGPRPPRCDANPPSPSSHIHAGLRERHAPGKIRRIQRRAPLRRESPETGATSTNGPQIWRRSEVTDHGSEPTRRSKRVPTRANARNAVKRSSQTPSPAPRPKRKNPSPTHRSSPPARFGPLLVIIFDFPQLPSISQTMAWRKKLTPAKLVDFLSASLDDTNESKAGLVRLAGGKGTPPPPPPPRLLKRARSPSLSRRRPRRPRRRSANCPKPRRTRTCSWLCTSRTRAPNRF